jgi:serine/threonine protein phosphatase PrpC
LETKVDELVEKALEAGGDDNITVVLMVNVKEQSDVQGGDAV